jgi:transposase-like protein
MPDEPSRATTSQPPKLTAKRRRKWTPSPSYSAEEKAQAILAVWTERARPAEICRQLGITWISFSQWQERAMEGMLQALQGRVNLANGQALSPRLQALLQKRQPGATQRLRSRLENLQQPSSKPTPLPPAKTPREAPSTQPTQPT